MLRFGAKPQGFVYQPIGVVVNPLTIRTLPPGWKLVIAAGLLTALFYGNIIDFSALGQLVTKPVVVIQITIIVLVAVTLSGTRWFLLLFCQGIHVSAIKSIQIVFITVFFSIFLPGGFLTSDALRIAYVVREAPDQRTAATWSIFFDRMIGVYAQFSLCFVFSLVYFDTLWHHLPLRILGLVAGAITFGLPLSGYIFLRWSHTPWGEWLLASVGSTQVRWILDRLVHAIDLYKNAPKQMLLVLALAVLNHALTIACILVIVVSSGIGTLAGKDYVLVTLWSTAANSLPITPGGLGVGEGSFDQIARLLETIPSPTGYGTIFLVFRIVSSLALLPGLFFYILYRNDFKNMLQTPKAALP